MAPACGFSPHVQYKSVTIWNSPVRCLGCCQALQQALYPRSGLSSGTDREWWSPSLPVSLPRRLIARLYQSGSLIAPHRSFCGFYCVFPSLERGNMSSRPLSFSWAGHLMPPSTLGEFARQYYLTEYVMLSSILSVLVAKHQLGCMYPIRTDTHGVQYRPTSSRFVGVSRNSA